MASLVPMALQVVEEARDTIERLNTEVEALRSQDAERTVDATGIVVSTLESRRSEVSGVSLDEEMTNMLRFQHAYSAAARVLTAMDENLSRLINQTGKVGM